MRSLMAEVRENAAKFHYGIKWYLHTVLTQYDRSARETHNIHSNAPIVQIYGRCVPWTVVCMRNANRRHLPLRKTVAMHAHTHTHRTAYRLRRRRISKRENTTANSSRRNRRWVDPRLGHSKRMYCYQFPIQVDEVLMQPRLPR